MKDLFIASALLVFLALTSGCHSGVVRGVGTDISKLGNHMQK